MDFVVSGIKISARVSEPSAVRLGIRTIGPIRDP